MAQSSELQTWELTQAMERIPFGSDVAQIVEIVNRDGGVILTDVLTLKEVEAVNRELEPFFEQHAGFGLAASVAEVHDNGPEDKRDPTGYEGSKTRHLQHAVKRSQTYRDKILDSELLHEYLKAVIPGSLGRCSCFASVVIETLPGEVRQNLHRDGAVVFGPFIGLGVDASMPNVFCNTILALTESTEEMGATRVIPRSGHWDDLSDLGSQDQTIPVELEPGEMFFYNGKTLHSGGANTTDRLRRVLATAFTLPATGLPIGISHNARTRTFCQNAA